MNVKFVNDEVNVRLQPTVSDKEKKVCDSETQQKASESIPVTSSHKNESDGTSQSLQSVEMNTARPPCMKAKVLRKQRKQNKLLAQGKTQEEIDAMFKENKQENHTKSLEKLFEEMCDGTNRLQVGFVMIVSSISITITCNKLVLLSPICLMLKIGLTCNKKVQKENFSILYLDDYSIQYFV